jgi:hypothetical protein
VLKPIKKKTTTVAIPKKQSRSSIVRKEPERAIKEPEIIEPKLEPIAMRPVFTSSTMEVTIFDKPKRVLTAEGWKRRLMKHKMNVKKF